MLQTREKASDESSEEKVSESMSVLDETMLNLSEVADESDDPRIKPLVDIVKQEVGVLQTNLDEHEAALDYVSKNPHVLTAGGEHEITAGNLDGEPVLAHEVSGEDNPYKAIDNPGPERRPDGVQPQVYWDEFAEGQK